MSWEHFGLEYMPVQKKGVEVLVTGLSGADDTTYYGWGTTITSWNERFFYSEKFVKNAQRFLPWVEQDVHNLGNWAFRDFGIVMVEGEFNGYTQASFFNALGYNEDICVFSGSKYLARTYRDPGLVRLRAVTFTRVDD